MTANFNNIILLVNVMCDNSLLVSYHIYDNPYTVLHRFYDVYYYRYVRHPSLYVVPIY